MVTSRDTVLVAVTKHISSRILTETLLGPKFIVISSITIPKATTLRL